MGATPELHRETGLVEHDLGRYMREPGIARRPEYFRRSDGEPILYAGALHALNGEPGGGKSWLSLAAVAQVIAQGQGAIFFDFESTPGRVADRLRALGADPQTVSTLLRYIQPDGPFGIATLDELRGLVAGGCGLVVVDSVSESMARAGLDENVAAEVIGWVEATVRPLARDGAAVLLVDHVTKSQADRGRWARGSGAKLAVVDGAAFTLHSTHGFSRQGSGTAELTVTKDREGCLGPVGAVAARVVFNVRRAGEDVEIRLDPPTGRPGAEL
jgi:hypothetical protein